MLFFFFPPTWQVPILIPQQLPVFIPKHLLAYHESLVSQRSGRGAHVSFQLGFTDQKTNFQRGYVTVSVNYLYTIESPTPRAECVCQNKDY